MPNKQTQGAHLCGRAFQKMETTHIGNYCTLNKTCTKSVAREQNIPVFSLNKKGTTG